MKNLFLRVLVYTLAIGSGVIVLSLLGISLVVWYSKRPEPWKKISGELEVVGKAIDWGEYAHLALDPGAIFELKFAAEVKRYPEIVFRGRRRALARNP